MNLFIETRIMSCLLGFDACFGTVFVAQFVPGYAPRVSPDLIEVKTKSWVNASLFKELSHFVSRFNHVLVPIWQPSGIVIASGQV